MNHNQPLAKAQPTTCDRKLLTALSWYNPTVRRDRHQRRTASREQSAGCNLGTEYVLYNGLGTGAFSLLAHLVMEILKALGFFTNVQVN